MRAIVLSAASVAYGSDFLANGGTGGDDYHPRNPPHFNTAGFKTSNLKMPAVHHVNPNKLFEFAVQLTPGSMLQLFEGVSTAKNDDEVHHIDNTHVTGGHEVHNPHTLAHNPHENHAEIHSIHLKPLNPMEKLLSRRTKKSAGMMSASLLERREGVSMQQKDMLDDGIDDLFKMLTGTPTPANEGGLGVMSAIPKDIMKALSKGDVQVTVIDDPSELPKPLADMLGIDASTHKKGGSSSGSSAPQGPLESLLGSLDPISIMLNTMSGLAGAMAGDALAQLLAPPRPKHSDLGTLDGKSQATDQVKPGQAQVVDLNDIHSLLPTNFKKQEEKKPSDPLGDILDDVLGAMDISISSGLMPLVHQIAHQAAGLLEHPCDPVLKKLCPGITRSQTHESLHCLASQEDKVPESCSVTIKNSLPYLCHDELRGECTELSNPGDRSSLECLKRKYRDNPSSFSKMCVDSLEAAHKLVNMLNDPNHKISVGLKDKNVQQTTAQKLRDQKVKELTGKDITQLSEEEKKKAIDEALEMAKPLTLDPSDPNFNKDGAMLLVDEHGKPISVDIEKAKGATLKELHTQAVSMRKYVMSMLLFAVVVGIGCTLAGRSLMFNHFLEKASVTMARWSRQQQAQIKRKMKATESSGLAGGLGNNYSDNKDCGFGDENANDTMGYAKKPTGSVGELEIGIGNRSCIDKDMSDMI